MAIAMNFVFYLSQFEEKEEGSEVRFLLHGDGDGW